MQLNDDEAAILIHYGMPRRSGRYPWGSHNNVPGAEELTPRNPDFLDIVKDLKKQGISEKKIADAMGMTILQLRAAHSIATNARRQERIGFAQRLKDKGYSDSAIAQRMNIPPSTVRGLLAPGAKDRADILTSTANTIKKRVDQVDFVDVGKGVEELSLGVSKTRLDTAVEMLKQEGYQVFNIKIPQLTGFHDTTTKVICKPGTTWAEAMRNRENLNQMIDFSTDGGRTYGHLHPPLELDPKRVGVVYKEEGGDKADGMIYVRPGVEDVSIGASNYAQVRVAVGKDHYLKGMAAYKKDLPDGIDIEFHTSKSRPSSGNKLDVMKANADEAGYLAIGEHPLMKSVTKQIVSDAGTDHERVTSAMNIVNEEGDWADWSHNFSSQMLSKQKPSFAKTQLNKTYESRVKEFERIQELTNPTVRKKLLETFANEADSAAVHLKAAALPRTGAFVLLPVPSIKKTEIYAPSFNNGESVVLIRHPHAGVFEIPELTVNNKNPEARRILGTDPRDAVGIHPSVAQHLSGADFDGDTILVIPNNQQKVSHSRPLDQLKDFDPRSSYPGYEGMPVMKNTQTEMGMISNLITDMSLQEASHAELARAVKHSMVVIDAEKHKLDHKRSYQDNNIKQLKDKYQGGGGASTFLSRAGAVDRNVLDRKLRPAKEGGAVDRTTGELVWVPTGKMIYDKKASEKAGYTILKPKKVRVKRGALTNDARTLMSPAATPMEVIYADHSNKLKSLANKARLAAVNTPRLKYSKTAKQVYQKERESLLSKLSIASRNRPLERQAQSIGNRLAKARILANPGMDDDTKKKVQRQALAQARYQTGADKSTIQISDDEWEAIQAGAISDSKLKEILDSADMDTVRSHATPKRTILMTPSKTARAKQMKAMGLTRAEIAQALGVSLTTLDTALKGG